MADSAKQKVSLRLTSETVACLDALALELGVSRAQAVELLVRFGVRWYAREYGNVDVGLLFHRKGPGS